MFHAFSLRRVAFGLWVAMFPSLALLLLWPVNSHSLRLGTLVALGVIILGSLFFAWRRRTLFVFLVCLCAATGLFLLLPGHATGDFSAWQAPYVEALASYEGVPYLWGGESRFGVDCSGLVRKALEDALLRNGLRTANPFLLRAAIGLWWNDTTAAGIGKGYDGRTVHVTDCKSLNTLDPATLRPGDPPSPKAASTSWPTSAATNGSAPIPAK